MSLIPQSHAAAPCAAVRFPARPSVSLSAVVLPCAHRIALCP